MTIKEVTNKYKTQLDYLDMEILIANSLGKTREFVLMHPEYEIPSENLNRQLEKKIARRMSGEPIAYILGHKEFYGLDFVVNKHTLIPRPETELMVEEVIDLLRNMLRSMLRSKTTVIDVGTGSGCIITSIAKAIENFEFPISNFEFFGTDISQEALKIAKKNAKLNNVNKKIKFLESDLLSAFIQDTSYKIQDTNLIITTNLPYLSKEIYNSAPIDVKKYEPKSALYSSEAGLNHYKRLFQQITTIAKSFKPEAINCFLEISPEQKLPVAKLIKSFFPKAKIAFQKDLAKKWRVCKISI